MIKYWVTIMNTITGEKKEVFVLAANEEYAKHHAVNDQRNHVFEWVAVSTREAIASKIFPHVLT